MSASLTRRTLIAGSVSVAALRSARLKAAGLPVESPDTPRLAMYAANPLNPAELRRIKQIGIDVINLPSMPPLPWTAPMLRAMMDVLATQGQTLGIAMIPWASAAGMDPGFLKIVRGAPDRDAEIDKVKASIVAAGQVGLPVVEYNFYLYRGADGYAVEPGRGGAGMQAYDVRRLDAMPPLPDDQVQSREATWANLEYFLRAVVPVAEAAKVRLSLHPNDPPSDSIRGAPQVMNRLADWKRLIATIDSPANGLTFDCGVTREIGEDPVAVCRHFAARDRINHVHFRNVRTVTPRDRYIEVFPDEGEVDMPGVMRTLVRSGYHRLILPEHPRGLDADKALPAEYARYVGWVYNVAYARGLLQAALAERHPAKR